jgi:hypothetical protein
LANERERAKRWEHKRQAAIEQEWRGELAQKMERDRAAERRVKEATAERAKRNRSLSQRDVDQKLTLHAAATTLALSRDRKAQTLANFRECSGAPRRVVDTWKNQD